MEKLCQQCQHMSRDEARMEFPTKPSLLDIGKVIASIASESQAYRLSRENCWFFASITQDLFMRCFDAHYDRGQLNHPDLVRQLRVTIRSRVYRDELRLGDLLQPIKQFAQDIGDVELTGAVYFALRIIVQCHKAFFTQYPPQDFFAAEAEVRQLLGAFIIALHEHLLGVLGIQGMIRFPDDFASQLHRLCQSWSAEHHMNLSLTHRTKHPFTVFSLSLTELLGFPLSGEGCDSDKSLVFHLIYGSNGAAKDPQCSPLPGHRLVLLLLKSLRCAENLKSSPLMGSQHLRNRHVFNLQTEFDRVIPPQVRSLWQHCHSILCECGSRVEQARSVMSSSIPALLHWVAAMGIMGELDQACHVLHKFERYLASEERVGVRELYRLVLQSKTSIATHSLSLLGGFYPFIPSYSRLRSLYPVETNTTRSKAWVAAHRVTSRVSWSPCVGQFQHPGVVLSLAYSPNESYVATGSRSAVYVWAAKSGAKRRTFEGHIRDVCSVAFSPDSTRLASADDGKVCIWDVATGELLRELDGCTSVAFSLHERHMATAAPDCAVKIWDVESGELSQTLTGHTSQVNSVSFSPNGRYLASCSDDKTVRVWAVAAEVSLHRLLEGHSDRVVSVAFSPDGSRLASASYDTTVCIWDVESDAPPRILGGHNDAVCSAVFTPDGLHLFTASRSSSYVHFWNAVTGDLLGQLPAPVGSSGCLAFSHHKRRLATGSENSVRVWEVPAEWCLSGSVGHIGPISSIAISSASRRVASASEDSTVYIWDMATSSPLWKLEGHAEGVYNIVYSPDARRLASTSKDKTVRIWDVRTGILLWTLEGHTGETLDVAFSPDSLTLASTSRDMTTRVWSVETGTLLWTIHLNGIHDAYSLNDRHLCIWDATTKNQILDLPLPPLPYRFDGHPWDHISFQSDSSILLKSKHYSAIFDITEKTLTAPSPSQAESPSSAPTVVLDSSENSLYVKREGGSLRLCFLPDYFEATTPVVQNESYVCIGGKSGEVVCVELDPASPSVQYSSLTAFPFTRLYA
ncbi:WD40-repeat-containing domain protein [Cantharellus anzutake]|uniref:WD40-repeat-containing domain protein n=1 Tax=Cantharellus anzutake TaxID=1750568 RepID=UPI0019043780|nr:WD40-repeat-containing domain protein [Cantharellus anzutake]KAF8319815.1 WD40-repeat-containing domain protein [Cantharellus anzutake]